MSRLATLMASVLILGGTLWLGGCTSPQSGSSGSSGSCNQPNRPNAPNAPNAPNSCNANPCGSGAAKYGMSPTTPTFVEGGSGWR